MTNRCPKCGTPINPRTGRCSMCGYVDKRSQANSSPENQAPEIKRRQSLLPRSARQLILLP